MTRHEVRVVIISAILCVLLIVGIIAFGVWRDARLKEWACIDSTSPTCKEYT